MLLVDKNELEISPILVMIENDLLGVSWTLVGPSRFIKLTSHVTVQSHRVLQLYCCTGSVLLVYRHIQVLYMAIVL
jgi:hypothetical protein